MMLTSICGKTELLPLAHPASLLPCQILNNYLLPKLSVRVSNYTKAICSCVKFEIIIYYQSYH